jgi:hypothetical protein
MKIYKSRYFASKDNDGKKIVKVFGGYVLMTDDQYKLWKQQT